MLGLVAVLVAAAAGAAALYFLLEKRRASGLPLAALRIAAWVLLAALLMDPGCRRAAPPPPVVLLDGSLSMTDPGGGGGDTSVSLARWRRAVDTARAIAGRAGRIIVFGAEPAPLKPDQRPSVPATRLLPAWREATALGGPVAVVTDGEVDDAAALPADVAATARIVVLPRPERTDVGIAGFDLPAILRSGDTATATVTLVAAHTTPADTATVELLERGRVIARRTIAVGAGGAYRRDFAFVPAPPGGGAQHEVRRYEVRVRGVADDAEPRDDARVALADVRRASEIALFSDSPDWDFRALGATLAATSGAAVSAYVRVSDGPWRDAATLRQVATAAVDDAARHAALVVVHGTRQVAASLLGLAKGSVWQWSARAAATPGDWYVRPLTASPLGAALAGVPVESLPPLEAVAPGPPDSGAWVGLEAQLSRRGRAWPVLTGAERGGRRTVRVLGTGLWRWASRGGDPAQAYASVIAAAANWLLEPGAGRGGVAAGGDLAAQADSVNRALDELLPRAITLRARPGARAGRAGANAEPLRHEPWIYAAAIFAMMMEWIARRRRGLP